MNLYAILWCESCNHLSREWHDELVCRLGNLLFYCPQPGLKIIKLYLIDEYAGLGLCKAFYCNRFVCRTQHNQC